MKTTNVLRRIVIAIACSMVALGVNASMAQTLDMKTFAELDSSLKKIATDQQYVGLGACLIKGDSVVWDGYHGYANFGKKIALCRDNIFPLMSLSKTVTAFALMQLQEQGLFGLDDDVNKYLNISVRSPHFPDSPITFRMLLNHTAGFADVTATGLTIPKNVARPPSARGDSPIPLEEYIKEILVPSGKYYSTDYFNTSTPGTQYSYSNIGYSLLGYLVERIARQDFAEYCKEHIFRPLKMNNSGWHLRDLDTAKILFGYSFSPNDSIPNYKQVEHFGEPGYPAGMLRTTMHDFVRFITVLLNRGGYGDQQLMKPGTIDLMLSAQNIKNIPSRAFRIIDRCLGWNITSVEGAELYTMNGFSGSAFSNAYFSMTERSGIIYYYTGLNMKNMAGMPEITKRLYQALHRIE